MRLRFLALAAVAALALAGCAEDPSLAGLTPEQQGEIQRQRYMAMVQQQQTQSSAFLAQQTRALQNQAAQTPTP